MISTNQLFNFLMAASITQFFIFLGFRGLKTLRLPPLANLRFFKIAWTIMLTMPLVFLAIRFFSWSPVEILINTPSVKAISSTVAHSPLVSSLSFKKLVSTGYLVGFLIFTFRFLLNLHRLNILQKNHSTGFIQDQEVRFINNIKTPFSAGFFKAHIYFPTELLGWSHRDTELALAHELHHCQNGDCRWKVIVEILNTFYFFLPTQWYLSAKFEDELEFYCDQRTIQDAKSSVKEYGTFLLWIAELPRTSFVLANNINDSTLKRRIVTMKSRMINRPFAVLALATLTIAGAITSVTLAAGNQIKQSFLVSSKIYINGKLISSPRIATLEGETVHISQKSDEQNFLELEMTADNANPNQAEELIFLDMKIKRVEQGHLSEAHPQLMVKNGEEGSIEIGDGSNPTFSMTVTAQKQ